ncbi:MAG: cytochrome c oxidase subunit II [Planctomycetota bacterium]
MLNTPNLLSLLAQSGLAQSGSSPWLPEQASTSAVKVDSALAVVFWISVFFFALIVGLMTIFVLRYRRKRGEGAYSQKNASTTIEIIWTAIPFVVVVTIFWAGFAAFLDLVVAPDDAMEIKVIGRRWSWAFEYPNGLIHDSLHVPVDKPVRLTMRSEDVIHSFYVPDFRLKMDVVPGRYNKAWFTATKVGEWPIYCAEYCGTGHSDMLSSVIVHPVGGYEEWLKRAADIFSPFLRISSFTNSTALLVSLKEGTRPIDTYLRGRLTEPTQARVAEFTGATPPGEDLLKTVMDEINDVIDGEPIHDEARFAGVELHAGTKEILAKEEPKPEEIAQLHRFLLADAYPAAIRRGPDPIEAGRKVYQASGCTACHALTNESGIGPGLGGLWGKQEKLSPSGTALVDENYLRESLIDPNTKIAAGFEPRMPTYKGQLSDRQIDALIAFIRALDTEGKVQSER